MGMLLILAVVVGAGVLLYTFFRRGGGGRRLGREEDEPLEIARLRYAEGKISREEFEQIERDLEGSREERWDE